MPAWICRRCNYMSGKPVCRCGKDNSQPDTVDGKADPTTTPGVVKFLGIALVAAAITAAIVALTAGTGGGAAPVLAPAAARVGVMIAALGAANAASAMTPNIETPPPTRRAGPTLPVTPPSHPKPGEKYYIFAVNTSGWSFYIGLPAEVQNRAGRSITDGGTGDQPIEYKKLVEQPFNSSQEARDYLKARVTPGKHSVWTGQWMKFGSEEYRTIHISGL